MANRNNVFVVGAARSPIQRCGNAVLRVPSLLINRQEGRETGVTRSKTCIDWEPQKDSDSVSGREWFRAVTPARLKTFALCSAPVA